MPFGELPASAIRQNPTFARQGGNSFNVRFGSKADIGLSHIDVRYSPKSGHASVSWTRLSEREASWLPLGCGLADRKGGNLYLGENL
jgi:hypothetical protein